MDLTAGVNRSICFSAKRYYEQFGFVPLPSNELALFLPLKTIQEALAGVTPPHSTPPG